MEIHGLQKLTLLDFPGHTACTVFTGRCNFRCPVCQNASLVLNPESLASVPQEDVVAFLEEHGEVKEYMASVQALVLPHVERYIARGFSHLQVCFGCTGGQHRSVYCAETLARTLQRRYHIRIRLTHRELGLDTVLG